MGCSLKKENFMKKGLFLVLFFSLASHATGLSTQDRELAPIIRFSLEEYGQTLVIGKLKVGESEIKWKNKIEKWFNPNRNDIWGSSKGFFYDYDEWLSYHYDDGDRIANYLANTLISAGGATTSVATVSKVSYFYYSSDFSSNREREIGELNKISMGAFVPSPGLDYSIYYLTENSIDYLIKNSKKLTDVCGKELKDKKVELKENLPQTPEDSSQDSQNLPSLSSDDFYGVISATPVVELPPEQVYKKYYESKGIRGVTFGQVGVDSLDQRRQLEQLFSSAWDNKVPSSEEQDKELPSEDYQKINESLLKLLVLEHSQQHLFVHKAEGETCSRLVDVILADARVINKALNKALETEDIETEDKPAKTQTIE